MSLRARVLLIVMIAAALGVALGLWSSAQIETGLNPWSWT